MCVCGGGNRTGVAERGNRRIEIKKKQQHGTNKYYTNTLNAKYIDRKNLMGREIKI